MVRRSSLLVLGLLATGLAVQVAACSSSDSGTPPTDAGQPTPDANQPTEDSGQFNPTTCSGPLPVLTVKDSNGNEVAPDWTCYFPDAGQGSFFHPITFVGDASDDGGDAASDDAGTDSSAPVDSGTDSSTPPVDSGTDSGAPATDGGDAGSVASGPYSLHIVDFSTLAPAGGATLDLFYGDSTNGTPDIAGATLDSSGVLQFTPPTNPKPLVMSYFLHASSTQAPVYWHDVIVVPPGVNAGQSGNGRAEANSVSLSTQTSLITSVFGSQQPNANAAVLVTAARDCMANDLQGAQLKLVDANGNDVATGTGATDPRGFYFVNNIPNETCTYTNNNERSIWALANAPVDPTGKQYSLQMWGRMNDSDPPNGRLIDTVPCELYSAGISIVRPYKQRLDKAPNK
jgi:hypothetical protein